MKGALHDNNYQTPKSVLAEEIFLQLGFSSSYCALHSFFYKIKQSYETGINLSAVIRKTFFSPRVSRKHTPQTFPPSQIQFERTCVYPSKLCDRDSRVRFSGDLDGKPATKEVLATEYTSEGTEICKNRNLEGKCDNACADID